MLYHNDLLTEDPAIRGSPTAMKGRDMDSAVAEHRPKRAPGRSRTVASPRLAPCSTGPTGNSGGSGSSTTATPSAGTAMSSSSCNMPWALAYSAHRIHLDGNHACALPPRNIAILAEVPAERLERIDPRRSLPASAGGASGRKAGPTGKTGKSGAFRGVSHAGSVGKGIVRRCERGVNGVSSMNPEASPSSGSGVSARPADSRALLTPARASCVYN